MKMFLIVAVITNAVLLTHGLLITHEDDKVLRELEEKTKEKGNTNE